MTTPTGTNLKQETSEKEMSGNDNSEQEHLKRTHFWKITSEKGQF